MGAAPAEFNIRQIGIIIRRRSHNREGADTADDLDPVFIVHLNGNRIIRQLPDDITQELRRENGAAHFLDVSLHGY